MMARIREAESDQMIGELKQKMAAMEIQKEEVLAADRLESKGGTQELANTIFDLQEEVSRVLTFQLVKDTNLMIKLKNTLTLFMTNKKRQTISGRLKSKGGTHELSNTLFDLQEKVSNYQC